MRILGYENPKVTRAEAEELLSAFDGTETIEFLNLTHLRLQYGPAFLGQRDGTYGWIEPMARKRIQLPLKWARGGGFRPRGPDRLVGTWAGTLAAPPYHA